MYGRTGELFRYLLIFVLVLGYALLYIDVGTRFEQHDAVATWYKGQHGRFEDGGVFKGFGDLTSVSPSD